MFIIEFIELIVVFAIGVGGMLACDYVFARHKIIREVVKYSWAVVCALIETHIIVMTVMTYG